MVLPPIIPTSSSSNKGAIAGGSAAVFSISVLLFFFILRRARKRRIPADIDTDDRVGARASISTISSFQSYESSFSSSNKPVSSFEHYVSSKIKQRKKLGRSAFGYEATRKRQSASYDSGTTVSGGTLFTLSELPEESTYPSQIQLKKSFLGANISSMTEAAESDMEQGLTQSSTDDEGSSFVMSFKGHSESRDFLSEALAEEDYELACMILIDGKKLFVVDEESVSAAARAYWLEEGKGAEEADELVKKGNWARVCGLRKAKF